MESTKFQIQQVPYSGKSGFFLNDIQLHSSLPSNPGKWYERLLFLFRKRKPGRIYSNIHKMFTTKDGRVGLELRFPVSKEMLANQKDARENTRKMRIFTRRDGVKIFLGKDLVEKIKNTNKRLGVTWLKDHFEARAQLSTGSEIDLVTGTATLKVILI